MPIINSSFTARIRNPGADRLLDYLARRFTYHSKEEWAELIAKERLTLESAVARGDEKLREGQTLRFAVVDYNEPEVPTDFRIVKREGDLCFVHKPAGMPVHRTGKIFFQTLANMVRKKLADENWSPLNRLDRETSGLVAFARGAEAFKEFSPTYPGTIWIKLYAAIVRGEFPEKSGSMNQPLGELRDSPIRSQMHPHSGGKRALTLFRTVAAEHGYSLLVLAPVTGRKHQIRAHLAEAGYPIVGDKIYSDKGAAYLKQLNQDLTEEDYRNLGATHHLLHSFYLRIGKSAETGINGAPAQEMEAWDSEVGKEFAKRFDYGLIKAWGDSKDCEAMMREAEAARNGFGI